MKIQPAHFEHMRAAIAELPFQLVDAIRTRAETDPRCRNTSMRIRWDLFNAAGLTPWACEVLYPYLDDSHIDTALRHIVPDAA